MFWTSELFAASMAQWLAEIDGLIHWLREDGAETVGTVGHSVGSLASGLAATLWSDLDFAIMMSPVGHHLEAIQKSDLAASIWPWMTSVSSSDSQLLDRWAPRLRRPQIQRILFMITLLDSLQPTELQLAWWEDWERPSKHEYRHGHISVVYGRQLYRDLEAFADDLL